jgi:hypothetical protein
MGFLRFVGRLLVVLIGLAIVLALVSFLLPREVTVTRSIVIDAPPEEVFPHIDSLQAFDKWSPWAGIDPEMQQSFSGPERGVGNRMEWSSDDPDVGSGSQEITVSIPNERVETALDFGEMGQGTAWLDLAAVPEGTEVTWGLLADMGLNPVGRYIGLMMDRWVGADYQRGLERLKEIVEAE